MTIDGQTFAIVDTSLAGAKAAHTLREEGFDGRLVLVGTEPERPYEQPPLSKEYLRGEAQRDAVFVHGASFYADNEIELRLGESVIDVDADHRELSLDTGEWLTFDRLLLATGAEPRRLTVPGSELEGIHYLRTLADGDALRERLDGGGRLVVVGAGFIGAEVAASARQGGLEVALIGPSFFAAGDVASHLDPRLRRLRVKHWTTRYTRGPRRRAACSARPSATSDRCG